MCLEFKRVFKFLMCLEMWCKEVFRKVFNL